MTSPSSTDTDTELVRQRFCTFAKIVAGVNSLGMLAHILSRPWEELWSLWFALVIAGIFLWLAAWWATRARALSVSAVRTVEITSLLCTAVVSGLLGRFVYPTIVTDLGIDLAGMALPHFVPTAGLARLYVTIMMTMGMAMMLAGRAGLVPSRPGYTALLTAGCFLPLTVMSTLPALPFDPPGILQVVLPAEYYGITAGVAAVWGLLATVVCTALSSAIYGLHKEVRKARRLGQYELEEKLGEGGMGAVYRARHAMMRRPTAVKLLIGTNHTQESTARFEREVQQTARLTHPNTITVYDYGRTNDGVFYYSMELLVGATLESVIAESGPMLAPRVLHVLRALAGALTEAHGIGLIHRDIKPANIYLAEQGGLPDTPKLLDFGLVKQLDQTEEVALTQHSALAGTPLFMSPESITSPDLVDGRSDLYALGAVAYFMLTGQHVFTGKSVVEVCSQHLHTEPAPVRQKAADTPDDLASLVMSCLAKEPVQRPKSALHLLEQLDRCVDARAWRPTDARQWWSEHPELNHSADTKPISTGEAHTLMADLNRLAGADHPEKPLRSSAPSG